MKKNTVLLIGNYSAGKTNFLARLWLSLKTRKYLLKSPTLPQDLTHLRAISQKLIDGRFADHTSSDFLDKTTIPIGLEDGKVGELVIPDFAGERVRDIYEKRKWDHDLEQLMIETQSCLIFVRVNSQHNIQPLDLITASKIWGAKRPANIKSPASVPTELMLVEWLQFFSKMFRDNSQGKLPRVGIVLSAWDAVSQSPATSLKDYFEQNYPILSQYYSSNQDLFDFALFGLSAIGGDIAISPEFKKEFVKDPLKFGFIVHNVDGSDRQNVDLTLPVLWALGTNDNIGEA